MILDSEITKINVDNFYVVYIYEDEAGRLSRMLDVFETYKYCMNKYFYDGNRPKISNLYTIHDHEGCLHIGWRKKPEPIEIDVIELAWNLEHECTVIHGINREEVPSKFDYWETAFRTA